MKLDIRLRSGLILEITDFQKVSYHAIEWKALTVDKFEQFTIYPKTTYHFVGTTKVSILGSEIEFLQLS